jgi:hypothetical protein
MPGFSDYLEAAILNNCLQGSAIAGLSTVWLSLHTADPTDAGTVGELAASTAGGYARQSVGSAVWAVATESGGGTTNAGYYGYNSTATISFPQCSGTAWADSSGTMRITAVGIWNHSSNVSSGNFLFGGLLSSARAVQIGDTFKFNAGDLQIILR